MANIDNVQLPDGSSYNLVDNTSGFATQNYVDSAVSSVTKTTIGLGNVDNTSDLNKPISTATQTALDTLDEDKADKTDIATVESGTTASRAYSIGELVYVSGTLYRVKTAIASGATFTVGTNVEVTNISSQNKGIEEFINNLDSHDVKFYDLSGNFANLHIFFASHISGNITQANVPIDLGEIPVGAITSQGYAPVMFFLTAQANVAIILSALNGHAVGYSLGYTGQFYYDVLIVGYKQ